MKRYRVCSPTWPRRDIEVDSLARLAERELDGTYHGGQGQVEAVADTAENNSRAIGRLLDVLVQRDLIALDDVVHILNMDDTTITTIA